MQRGDRQFSSSRAHAHCLREVRNCSTSKTTTSPLHSAAEERRTYGVLGAAGDADALTAIKSTIQQLEAPHDKLSEELGERDQVDGDR